jgi:hypothetical protein
LGLHPLRRRLEAVTDAPDQSHELEDLTEQRRLVAPCGCPVPISTRLSSHDAASSAVRTSPIARAPDTTCLATWR